MDLLINFCPRCGERVQESIIGKSENGGDWICTNCNCTVEAYVLGNNPNFTIQIEKTRQELQDLVVQAIQDCNPYNYTRGEGKG